MNFRHPRAVVAIWSLVAAFAVTQVVAWIVLGGASRPSVFIFQFVVLLYTKFFDWWWEAMPKYLFFLVLGLTAVLFLLVLKRLRGLSQPAPEGVS